MIRKKLYPKTTRLGKDKTEVTITEKLDGSNLTFFKHPKTEKLGIGQRNIIYYLDEIDNKEVKQVMYKELHGWLNEYGKGLEEQLRDGAAVIGEWLGMGQIKYDLNNLNRFHIFAKANVNQDVDMYNIYYDNQLFIYPFKNQEVPSYISIVPIVEVRQQFPSVAYLDYLYGRYVESTGRKIEGFCINDGLIVRKYVRLKNGELSEHKS